MTLVVGVDVTVVDRIAGALRRNPRFAQRIYTDGEQRYAAAKPERWASRWAAKEAVLQLLGARPKPGLSYRDIELRNDSLGKPTVRLRGGLRDLVVSQGIQEILVAIAHSRMHAVAHAIALGGTGKSMLDDEG